MWLPLPECSNLLGSGSNLVLRIAWGRLGSDKRDGMSCGTGMERWRWRCGDGASKVESGATRSNGGREMRRWQAAEGFAELTNEGGSVNRSL